MKLLIITAVSEFETDIKLLLKKSEVQVFSCQEVTGYKDVTDTDIEGNWFAGEMISTNSILCYAFVTAENVNDVIANIDEFNNKQDFLSKVHVAEVAIERTNTFI
ncbi:hypothetical protein NBRC110019_05680 [Neptunitalea chrysea]|uniref:Uncharacterized protein n=1 Tax=Neptunitalea chrysea TaxID=1647581 RepID=A0A9W6ETS1_9FLAO|nr:hypothetical protein [Neptunitalea chrysea]GLB51529.1 hypothetical protein NBRC110019_05680 [Neptunitalea chrysea]